MKSGKKVIDHLDITLPVHPELQELCQRWLDRFSDEHDYIEATPRLRRGTLLINSTDLISFLGYIDPTGCPEIEMARFKRAVRTQLENQLLYSVSQDTRAHYQWCLTALKSFAWGRYLSDDASGDE